MSRLIRTLAESRPTATPDPKPVLNGQKISVRDFTTPRVKILAKAKL